MRLLIVEDVEEMLELLVELVRSMPSVEGLGRARNGADARMELLRHRPDVALIDEILPGESASDLASEFAAAGVPVIFMTSSLASKSGLPSGVLGRFLKPDWDDLALRRPEIQAMIAQVARVSRHS